MEDELGFFPGIDSNVDCLLSPANLASSLDFEIDSGVSDLAYDTAPSTSDVARDFNSSSSEHQPTVPEDSGSTNQIINFASSAGSSAPKTQRRPQLDSPYILQLCSIIEGLENYISSELKALDLILNVVKYAVTQLTEIFHHQQSLSIRTMPLLTTIMYQILELLEAGCKEFFSNVNHLLSRSPGRATTEKDLGFAFGIFKPQAQEQTDWKARMVLRDLHQCSELLQKITAVSVAVARQENQSRPAAAGPDCYSDLRDKLQKLTQEIEKYRL